MEGDKREMQLRAKRGKDILPEWERTTKSSIIPEWERSNQRVKLPNWEKPVKKEGNGTLKRITVRLVNILLVVIVCIVGFAFAEFFTKDMNYEHGIMDSFYFLLLGENIQTLYNTGEITEEQYENVVKEYNNIINAIFSDSKITLKMCRAYNRALEENEIRNCQIYKILIGKWYMEGFKDGVKCKVYKDVIIELYDAGIITKEEYNTFATMYNEQKHKKENITATIEYAEEVIQRVRNSGTCDVDLLLSSHQKIS